VETEITSKQNVELDYQVGFIPLEVKTQRDFECIEPYLSQKHTIVSLDVHSDAVRFLGNNVIQNNYSLSIDSQYLTTNKKLNTKARPYMVIIGDEKKKFFQSYNYLNGAIIGDAIAQTYYLKNGKTLELRLRFLNGDNKAIWALLSNKCGGNFRCWGCCSPFDNKNIKKNLFIHEFIKFRKKNLYSNFTLFLEAFKKKKDQNLTTKEAEDIGLSSSPYFAEALFYSFRKAEKTEEEFLEALKRVNVGVDNLHNIRGWILYFISCLKENKRLNEIKYNSLLKEHGLSQEDTSGGKLRLLILNFEKIILPSLVYDKANKNQFPITEKIREILSFFRIIVWVAYSPEEAQAFDGIKLLLRFKCFQFSRALQSLNGFKFVDLYLHVILSHFPDFFDEHSFYLASTEPLELLFVTTKRCKHSTNRQKMNIVKKVIKRFENILLKDVHDGDPNTYLKSISRTENKNKDNKFKDFRKVIKELKDVTIEKPAENDHSIQSQEIRSFLESISHYKNNVFVDGGKYHLKMSEDIHKFFDIYEKEEEF
jgi:hypothetical protein